MSNQHTTSVLLVGGGLVGLSAGLFLQRLGVPFILVERNAKPSPLPRSRGIHVRTLELFRQVGLEDAVQAAAKAAWGRTSFGGARRGRTLVSSEALPTRSMASLVGQDPSPSHFCACPQPLLEPVLRAPLMKRGGDVRFGHELVSFEPDANGVTAVARAEDASETRIRASYLVGVDGGRSTVRALLDIGTETTPAERHYLNLYFRADLTEQVRDRTFSQCEIGNERVRGLFLSKNNTDEWSFHLEYDPTDPHAVERSDAELVDLVRAAIGADVPVDLLHRSAWSTAVRIAERYRVGRVFLAGDATHVMPPWGGFNGNTGVADVHNLAWKLAAVLDGRAPDSLLDTYEVERRPIAVRNGRQARLRTDFDARFDIETEANRAAIAQLKDVGALLMRYRYAADNEPVPSLRAQAGTRFPHAWIERDGTRRSTLDLFGKDFVLLGGPSAPPTSRRTYRAGVDFTLDETSWHALTGLPDDGTVLLRPDGFVAERSDETVCSR